MLALLGSLASLQQHSRAATSPAPEDVLTVLAGQTLLLEYEGVQRVSIGDATLLQVEVLESDDEVLLIALEPGITDLRLWAADDEPLRYIVQVHDDTEYVSPESIRRLVDDVPGVSVEALGRAIVLEGQVQSESELAKVNQVAEQYPSVSSYVTAPVFERKPTILMHARLLEIRRTALKELGISWNSVINGPVTGLLSDVGSNPLFRLTDAPGIAAETALPLDASTSTFTGISTSLSSTINLLLQNGNARLLAEPTLASVSGGSANFLVGGEVPIPSRDDSGAATVQFKEFGIILRVSSEADGGGFIRTDVEVEVSSLDPSIQVLGIPGFATRKTDTRMNLAEGDTMVIAGLVSHEDAKNVEKVPLLGQIPILGELFKSRQFRNQETELVVLITPTLIDADSRENRAYQRRFEALDASSARDVRFTLLD